MAQGYSLSLGPDELAVISAVRVLSVYIRQAAGQDMVWLCMCVAWSGACTRRQSFKARAGRNMKVGTRFISELTLRLSTVVLISKTIGTRNPGGTKYVSPSE
ncbi:hypothetical protein J6590_036660 [Homalodisca vitripennis]|nr:hypothetical protein J6590_036660 [Homalodisca vitripennis]